MVCPRGPFFSMTFLFATSVVLLVPRAAAIVPPPDGWIEFARWRVFGHVLHPGRLRRSLPGGSARVAVAAGVAGRAGEDARLWPRVFENPRLVGVGHKA